jgi:coenzyme Q-binding protein COQ10
VTTRIKQRIRLFFNADNLFELVSDIRRYPEFIPQITAMRVLKENQDGPVAHMTAEARIRYKVVTERFTSQVAANTNARSIDVGFVSGPFRVLSNAWRFHALSDGSTLVDFDIEAAFKNAFLQMLLDGNKDRAAGVLVRRFSDEAERRFSPSGNPDLDLSDEIDALAQ